MWLLLTKFANTKEEDKYGYYIKIFPKAYR